MAHLPYGHINIYNITGTLHASHFVQLVVVKYQIFNVDGVELKKCSFDVMLVHQEQVIMQSQIVVALTPSMPLDLMGTTLGMQ